MNRLEAYIDWLLRVNKFDDPERPTTSEAEYWINNAYDKFIKTRYSGHNAKMEGFEQSQKRIEDLKFLLKQSPVSLVMKGNKQTGTLPDDLMIFIGDECFATPTSDPCNLDGSKAAECWPTEIDKNGNRVWVAKLIEVTDATRDTIHGNLINSLSPHIYAYGQARPYRLIIGDSVEIYTDGTYKASDYTITYIKVPEKISLYFPRELPFCELPKHTHSEIIHMAADLYLAAIGAPTAQIQNQIEQTIE
jgi:hypothetical protein